MSHGDDFEPRRLDELVRKLTPTQARVLANLKTAQDRARRDTLLRLAFYQLIERSSPTERWVRTKLGNRVLRRARPWWQREANA